jgi:hypothetical protein
LINELPMRRVAVLVVAVVKSKRLRNYGKLLAVFSPSDELEASHHQRQLEKVSLVAGLSKGIDPHNYRACVEGQHQAEIEALLGTSEQERRNPRPESLK